MPVNLSRFMQPDSLA